MGDIEKTLEPMSGFTREIGFYLSGWESIRAHLREIVSDLSKEELASRIVPGAHQIGNLILHLGEAEASWIHAIIADKKLSDAEKKFAHWCDTTERDFAEKNYSVVECVARIDEISRLSRGILVKFTDDDLDKLFPYERSDGERVQATLRWVLIHLIEHEAEHKGQISMLKRLLREARN